MVGWEQSAAYTQEMWIRAVGTLVATLLVFGIVRFIVKKLVNGLLAQPSDALFGFVVGALIGALIIAVWAKLGICLEYSNLASALSAYLK